jgi:integrase
MDTDDSKSGRDTASADMLRHVLDGKTYDAVASDFGITRTAVERRIKALASRLCRDAGALGGNVGATAFVSRLRAARLSLLQALDNHRATATLSSRTDRVVSEEEVAAGALRIRGRSPEPWRDVALFYLLFATGARPLEVARLSVGDYLTPGGAVRRESELPARASTTGRARPLYFASARLDEALGHYLRQRLERGHGVGNCLDRYRGLDPDSRLFLTPTGEPFRISHANDHVGRRSLCRPMLEVYRKLFRYAALEHSTPLSARRTLAARLIARGADEEQVGLILGIRERRAVRALLQSTRRDLPSLVADLV